MKITIDIKHELIIRVALEDICVRYYNNKSLLNRARSALSDIYAEMKRLENGK